MDPFTHFKSNIAFKIFVVIIKMSLKPNWSSVFNYGRESYGESHMKLLVSGSTPVQSSCTHFT